MFSDLPKHCAHIPPLAATSFINRQRALARTLHASGASAYIAEPGASASFFANLSSSQWGLSERPLLLIVSPDIDAEGDVHARVTILTPAFEATRAKMLPIPSVSHIKYPVWSEDANPFAVAVSAIPQLDNRTIFVDGAVRTFITDGLQHAAQGSSVISAPVEIRRLRERKSKEELEIMKCANEVIKYLYAISLIHFRIHLHILGNSPCPSSCAKKYVHWNARVRGSWTHAKCPASHWAGAWRCSYFVWGYVCVGPLQLSSFLIMNLSPENAALPHGTGSDRVLGKYDLALIDTSASLHGYWSDLTRVWLTLAFIEKRNHSRVASDFRSVRVDHPS